MKCGRIPTAAALAVVAAGLAVLAAGPAVPAGAQQDRGVVGAALGMRQLDGVKRVLMIAAHPDDEDTGLLTALARGMGAETAYLSLSRGEGGQNLIGPRLHEGLGVIRTGELLAARALDGGEQYFTRAFDFGYSKTLDEALELWPLEEVLRDVVYVVRKFRPHVIVSVFSGTPRDGHGQHQLAGIAAREAFAAAGDPDRFPELAAHGVTPWQPAKLYNSNRSFSRDGTVSVPTGTFDPVLGRSHYQLAMESRSQHRSQDMGSGQSMGPRSSSLRLEASAVEGMEGMEDDGIFAGVDTTLIGQLGTLLPAGWPADTERRLARYRGALAAAAEGFSATRPDGAVAGLAEAAAILQGLLDEGPAGADPGGADPGGPPMAGTGPADGRRVLERRLAQLSEAIFAAAGIVTEARVGRNTLTPGESVTVDVTVWNGGAFDLVAVAPELVLPPGWTAAPTDEPAPSPSRSPFFRQQTPPTPADGTIAAGDIGRWSWRVAIPADAAPSVPYYLHEERDGALHRWPADPALWALPFDPAPITARVAMELAGGGAGAAALAGGEPGAGPLVRGGAGEVVLTTRRTAEYVGVDQAFGEYREAVLIMPALNVEVDPPWMVWPSGALETREVTVALTNTSTEARSGTVSLEVPDGWAAEPADAAFALEPHGASGSFTFAVTPRGAPAEGSHAFRAVVREALAGAETGTPGNAAGGGIGARREPPRTASVDTPANRDRFPDRLSGGFQGEFVTAFDIVDFPHIPRTLMAREAAVRVSVFPVAVDTDLRVGYVTGSGDDGAVALRQLGMTVDELGPNRVLAGDYTNLDVVVLGVRAYETRPDLVAANEGLLDFARGGGTVIVQYNKYEFSSGGYAPYPATINRPHDRVTDETAPVTVLLTDSPVLTRPNPVGPADFEGWVQERGLYFLGEWDARYTPVMEMADPGEEPIRGGLVVAPLGDGLYVYTGLAFFRQFPAGVPGAYRLFANLVSLRARDWRRPVE